MGKGLDLLKKAIQLHHPLAMQDYSYFLFHGLGIEQDKSAAIQLLEKANKLANGAFTQLLNQIKKQ